MASVGINLLWLVPGVVGGSEQSTVATLTGFAESPPTDLDLRLFVLPAFAAAYPELVGRLPTEVASIDGRSRARRVLAESTWLAGRAADLDLMHYAGGTVPIRRRAPSVVTLHDLQPLEARATHSVVKRAYLSAAIPAALRAARRVAVPSEFVRRTVEDRFHPPAGRVVVVPHVVPLRPPPTPAAALVAAHRLTGPVVLYPAITYPHKEHGTLLAAFERVLAEIPDAVLVLPGGEGSSEAEVQRKVAASAPLQAAVRRLGRIDDADVAGLLALATVVAVPSRYEGFGLPALEAMAAGVPVVAADATSLPEVVGDSGRLVPVGDVEAWATALTSLLRDPEERGRLAEAGRRRTSSATAAASANAFAELYRAALSAP